MKTFTEPQKKELRNYTETIKTKEKKMAKGGYRKPSEKSVDDGQTRRDIETIMENRELKREMSFLL